MKRNILRKNLSEDLTWAEFLKSEFYQQNNMKSQHFMSFISSQTKSMHSTPEKKHEIPNEGVHQLANNDNPSASSSNK